MTLYWTVTDDRFDAMNYPVNRSIYSQFVRNVQNDKDGKEGNVQHNVSRKKPSILPYCKFEISYILFIPFRKKVVSVLPTHLSIFYHPL